MGVEKRSILKRFHVLRRIFIFVTLIAGLAVFVGWRYYGSGAGFLLASATVVLLAVFTSLVWSTAKSLERADSQREHETEILRQNEARKSAIVESALDCIIIMDHRGIITEINPATEQTFGYTREEMLGRAMAELIIPPQHRESHRRGLAHYLATGEGPILRKRIELTALRKDGSEFPVELTVRPIREGEHPIFTGTVRDITARKRAEEASGHLAAIVASSDDAIISKDLNGIIRSWNQGAERLFGYSAQEAIGRPIRMIIPPDRQKEEDNIIARLRRGERIDHFETVRVHKSGTLIDVSITISPVKDAQGKIIGASKVGRDIRDLIKSRQTLEQHRAELEQLVAERTARLTEALRELESFSYSMAHDMRAPLRAMQGFAKILQDEFLPSMKPEAADYLKRIMLAAQRLDSLIQDVLSYSQVLRADLPLETVDLNRFVPEVVAMYPNLSAPEVQISIDGPLHSVRANPAALTQVVSNLLGNAVKFVSPGVQPNIRIWAEALPNSTASSSSHGDSTASGYVRLWIQDNGIGIPPHAHGRLFQMFQRINRPGVYEGTGMGLAIVQKAMERMGGDVGLESDVGKGSRFWIRLPRP